jgi:hypothetical protein
LKYIYFEIDIRYYFKFDSIGNNNDQVHFLVGAELGLIVQLPIRSETMLKIRETRKKKNHMTT